MLALPVSLSHGFSHSSADLKLPLFSPLFVSRWRSRGSALDPLSFSIYTSLIAHTVQAHGIQQQQYGDDTQRYVALSPNSMFTHVSALQFCLESLQTWICANSMTPYADKSNAIVFATSQ